MIDLTIDQLRAMFRYEPDTGHIYRKYPSRNGVEISKPVGWELKGHRRLKVGKKQVWAHRLAWALYYGEWIEMIDHKDRNGMNNRIDNLRRATHSQNNANRRPGGLIPAKGVCLNSKRTKYMAEIRINNVKKFLGHYDTVDEAAHAYNKAAVKYHGEFALLNPIGTDK